MQNVFDLQKLRHNKQLSLKGFDAHDFLFSFAAESINDRFSDIKRDFEQGLLIGRRGEDLIGKPEAVAEMTVYDDLSADLEDLSLEANSLDCVIGNMCQHHVNDLPGHLIQINRALKPDGLFIGAMIGGESLFELKESFMAVEMALYGGAAPHIHPFADKQQMGALMQRAGFALPVVDSDLITVSYTDIYKLMKDVKGMGEGYALNVSPRHYSHAFFEQVDSYYKEHFKDDEDETRIQATFEIIYLLGWAPHESQQKPLKPGSAETKMTDVL
ncbi:MAG: SAM-dependent methyltransferase [Micavibrio sp.]|nr:SAM-dependent methyltransferase [Micavibrio sp.]|tara:strand:+ start:97 stop:912 length:816 start_codon:yes stop_codon:yes gene_type:complete